MKMNIKLDIKNIDISKYASELFLKRKKQIFVLISMCLLGYCGYLWYFFIGNPNWNETKKADYISTTKAREAVFNQDKFYSLVSSIDERKRKYQENVSSLHDIFGL
jgi:hypothetical protein